MGMAFLKKLTDIKTFGLYCFSWRRIVLSVLILGCKIWEEQAVWLQDFVGDEGFKALTIQDLGQLEAQLLALLEFDVNFVFYAQGYASMYFELHAQSNIVSGNKQPLTKEAAEKLELKMKRYNKNNLNKSDIIRFTSADNFNINSKQKSQFMKD